MSCHSHAQAPTIALYCPIAPTSASPTLHTQVCSPSPRDRESHQDQGFCPWCREGFKGRCEAFKADFPKTKPGGLELRALGPSKNWDLPFLSPACSLYRNGNLPLRPHCLWDSRLHNCGVFTGVIPSATSPPHPPLPASVFGKLAFFGRRAGGQLGPGSPPWPL